MAYSALLAQESGRLWHAGQLLIGSSPGHTRRYG